MIEYCQKFNPAGPQRKSRAHESAQYTAGLVSLLVWVTLFILKFPLLFPPNFPNTKTNTTYQSITMQKRMVHNTPVNEGVEADALSFDSLTSTDTPVVDTKRSSSSRSEFITWPSSRLGSFSAKPHAPTTDPGWDAIRRVQILTGLDGLGINDLKFIRRVGSGDIGSVYLVELKGARGCLFAVKVMDKEELASRGKESRARIEREILEMLDHPFLPTLYATIDSERWSCLLTEFCPGGDLHILRQRQPGRRFSETAVR